MDSTKFTEKEAITYWKQLHTRDINELAIVCYPEKSVFFNKFFDKIQKFAIMRAIKTLNIDLKDKEVLDIGCGRGRWLQFYMNLNARITGIDIAFEGMRSCYNKGFKVVNGSTTTLPFKDNSFDFVNSVAVLLHIPTALQPNAVNEIERVLKPGGISLLIENTGNDPSPHVFSRGLKNWCELFQESDLIYSESHCYIWALRTIWYFQKAIGIQHFNAALEPMAIAMEHCLEFLLMKIWFKQQNKNSLQHIMIFKKR